MVLYDIIINKEVVYTLARALAFLWLVAVVSVLNTYILDIDSAYLSAVHAGHLPIMNLFSWYPSCLLYTCLPMSLTANGGK